MDGWIWQRNFFQGALEVRNAALRSHGNRAWLPVGYSWFQVCLLFPGRSRTSWTTRRQRNPRRKRGEGDDLALPLGIKGFLLFVAAKETLREMGFLPKSSIQESRGSFPCVEIQSSWKGNQGETQCSAPWLSMGMEIPWICSGFSCSVEISRMNSEKLPWQDPVSLCFFREAQDLEFLASLG